MNGITTYRDRRSGRQSHAYASPPPLVPKNVKPAAYPGISRPGFRSHKILGLPQPNPRIAKFTLAAVGVTHEVSVVLRELDPERSRRGIELVVPCTR